MMRPIPGANRPACHPDDIAARGALLDDYVRREARGVTVRSLAKTLGFRRHAVECFERRRPANPLVASLVRYGEPLELRPVLELHDLEVETPPAAVALLACGYVGASMLATLVTARRESGMSQSQLASRANGWSGSAVANLEREDAEPRLSSLQRYARGLGGWLEARWEEL